MSYTQYKKNGESLTSVKDTVIKPASYWNKQLRMLEEKVTYRKKLIDADYEAEKEEL